MQIQVGCVTDLRCALNRDSLLKAYADESQNMLTPIVSPDWDLYLHLEELGMMDFIKVINDDKTLVGFMTLITTVLPHYTEPATTIESFFVLEEYRGAGTAKKMMAMAELLAVARNAKNIMMSAPIGGTLARVSASFGFSATSIAYMKKI